jgi:hypothetical protein
MEQEIESMEQEVADLRSVIVSLCDFDREQRKSINRNLSRKERFQMVNISGALIRLAWQSKTMRPEDTAQKQVDLLESMIPLLKKALGEDDLVRSMPIFPQAAIDDFRCLGANQIADLGEKAKERKAERNKVRDFKIDYRP